MLSQTCEYALRAVTYIAQHEQDGSILAREVASHTNVPLKYLQKILRDLVRSGVLSSVRGIGGGFRLRKSARELHLLDVVTPFADPLERTTCPFGNPRCRKDNPCPVHDRWVRVVEAYRTFLETTRVQDLLDRPLPEREQE